MTIYGTLLIISGITATVFVILQEAQNLKLHHEFRNVEREARKMK